MLLKEEDPNYPVFTVQVPEDDVDYVTLAPAEVFFIAFEDIFNLFHTRRLGYNLVRLYALYMAMKIKRDNTPYVTVVDPYYMCDNQLVEGSRTRAMAMEYLQRFMLRNKTKNNHLLLFFASKYTSARRRRILCFLIGTSTTSVPMNKAHTLSKTNFDRTI